VTVVQLDPAAIERTRASAPLLSDLERLLPRLEWSLQNAHAHAERRHRGSPPGPAIVTGLSGRAAPATEPLGGPSREPAPDPLDLDLELVEDTLVEFIREEVVRRRGFGKVVVGVS